MYTTVAMRTQRLVGDARLGELFVPLCPDFAQCVCALRVELPHFPPDDDYRDVRSVLAKRAAREPRGNTVPVVVIGCRVREGQRGFTPVGVCLSLRNDLPIVSVEQIEPAAMRERIPPAIARPSDLADVGAGPHLQV